MLSTIALFYLLLPIHHILGTDFNWRELHFKGKGDLLMVRYDTIRYETVYLPTLKDDERARLI